MSSNQSRSGKPEAISSLLNLTLKNLNLDSQIKRHSVWTYWNKIVGTTIADKAWPERIFGDTLVVKVSNSSWMNELSYMKTIILDNIHKEIKDCPIKFIRLEVGSKKFEK